MFPLGGEAAVFGDHGPLVRHQSYVAFASVDHGLDGEGHAGLQDNAGACFSVVQHLWLLVKDFANAVAAVFAHHGKVVGFGVFLDAVADVAQMDAGFDHFHAQFHAFVADTAQAFGEYGGFADDEHFAGVAMVTVFDNGDVDVDNVTILELFGAGDAVADLVVYRGTDGFGETVVVERGRDGLLLIDGVVVADLVQLIGGDAGLNVRGNHAQLFRSQSTGYAHFFDIVRGFQGNAHNAFLLCASREVRRSELEVSFDRNRSI